MADVEFVINRPGWETAFHSQAGTLGVWVRGKTGELERTTIREAPAPGGIPHNRTGINYATGVLAAGHTSRVTLTDRTPEGRVIVHPKHAIYVLKGTRPHVIRPKLPGGRLRFFWHRVGRFVIFRQVHHPGTAANNYMMRALERTFRDLLP